MKKYNKRKFISVSLIVLILTAISNITAFAAVDLAGGINEMAAEVTGQIKAVAVILFGVAAVILLIFTIVKGVKAFALYRANQDYHVGPVIGCGIATVVCSLCAAGTMFSPFGV